MITEDTAQELLSAAESIDDPEVTRAVISSIGHFGLDDDGWYAVAPRVRALASGLPVGSSARTQFLTTLATLPLTSAYDRLNAIANDDTDPDHDQALRLLAEIGDSYAQSRLISQFRAALNDGPDASVLEGLAVLPIERFRISPEEFAGCLESNDRGVRLWSAIALARLGEVRPLTAGLVGTSSDSGAFDAGSATGSCVLDGSPWVAYESIARARPLPRSLVDRLLALPVADSSLVVWALTGSRDAEGAVIEREAEPVLVPTPHPSAATSEASPSGSRGLLSRLSSTIRTAIGRPSSGDRAPTEDEVRPTNEVGASTQTPEAAYKVLADGAMSGDWPETQIQLAPGETLTPADSSALVQAMFEAAMRVAVESDPGADTYVGNRIMEVLPLLDTSQLPIADLASVYIDADAPGLPETQMAALLGQAGSDAVAIALGGLLVQSTPDKSAAIAGLLEGAAAASASGSLPTIGAGPRSPGTPTATAHSLWDGIAMAEPPMPEPPTTASLPTQDDFAEAPSAAVSLPPRKVFARIDVGPDILLGQPFNADIGLSEIANPAVHATGAMTFDDSEPIADLECCIAVDPASIIIEGAARRPLVWADDGRLPVITFVMTAVSGQDLDRKRRIGVYYLRAGRIIGFAWREIVPKYSADDRDIPDTGTADDRLLDLSPLTGEEPPDLVLAVRKADRSDNGTYLWTAFPSDSSVPVIDGEWVASIGQKPDQFAAEMRRSAKSGNFSGVPRFAQFKGFGTQIARAMPEGAKAVLREIACKPNLEQAASVLLLTEEPYVPWELAVFTPPLSTPFGGDSPFLGAHVAIGRWPLASSKPRPTPVPRRSVRRPGVITADYEGIAGWPKLEAAQAEADQFKKAYSGDDVIPPVWTDVRNCLEGDPPFDLLHFALHGQFSENPDAADENGVVLIGADEGKGPKPQFLTRHQVEGLTCTINPFVFLNACQVGAAGEELGVYSGLAESFLRAGACAVVAPVWNVEDTVAANLSRRFYESALSASPVPVAEILRRERASYTEHDIELAPNTVTPTLISYQFYGHPLLRLSRTPQPSDDTQP